MVNVDMVYNSLMYYDLLEKITNVSLTARHRRWLRRIAIQHIKDQCKAIADQFNNHKGQRTYQFEQQTAYYLDELRGGEEVGGRNWLKVFRSLSL